MGSHRKLIFTGRSSSALSEKQYSGYMLPHQAYAGPPPWAGRYMHRRVRIQTSAKTIYFFNL